MLKRNFQFAVLLALVAIAAGCAIQAPKSINGTVAYAVKTVDAIQQTAIDQRQYLSDEQADKVRALVIEARNYRDIAVTAAMAKNESEAETAIGKLNAVVSTLQSILNKGAHNEQ